MALAATRNARSPPGDTRMVAPCGSSNFVQQVQVRRTVINNENAPATIQWPRLRFLGHLRSFLVQDAQKLGAAACCTCHWNGTRRGIQCVYAKSEPDFRTWMIRGGELHFDGAVVVFGGSCTAPSPVVLTRRHGSPPTRASAVMRDSQAGRELFLPWKETGPPRRPPKRHGGIAPAIQPRLSNAGGQRLKLLLVDFHAQARAGGNGGHAIVDFNRSLQNAGCQELRPVQGRGFLHPVSGKQDQ